MPKFKTVDDGQCIETSYEFISVLPGEKLPKGYWGTAIIISLEKRKNMFSELIKGENILKI